MTNSCLNPLIRTCLSLPNNRPSTFTVSSMPEMSLLIFYWYAKPKRGQMERDYPLKAPNLFPKIFAAASVCDKEKKQWHCVWEESSPTAFFLFFLFIHFFIFVWAVHNETCLRWSQWPTVSKAWRWSCFGVLCCLPLHNLTELMGTSPFKGQQKPFKLNRHCSSLFVALAWGWGKWLYFGITFLITLDYFSILVENSILPVMAKIDTIKIPFCGSKVKFIIRLLTFSV